MKDVIVLSHPSINLSFLHFLNGNSKMNPCIISPLQPPIKCQNARKFFFSEPFLNGIIPSSPAVVSTWPTQNGKGFVPTSLSSVLLEEKGYNMQWSF
ncbi:hypothetical protein NPIL_40191 [Nephila pilipes]|uniref:Uncharacterized protein n=1 Tax=Nephila pilipes TaxID=299642 RepID=A0A8X6UA64_NEPPI|nr:hypothetical protein NPIL_40191 [Nephila pilipes]